MLPRGALCPAVAPKVGKNALVVRMVNIEPHTKPLHGHSLSIGGATELCATNVTAGPRPCSKLYPLRRFAVVV